ncbi:MAG: alpha/beta fold hydrolase [Flavobacteriia bacterium]|nr:alpha/beta fold hydrolase [Flavobacteriia bacterium]
MKLHSLEFGEGQVFIIIHGLFGYSDNWVSFAKKIASFYKVVLLDMRNHGHSPWSDDFSYSLMAQDVKEYVVSKNYKNIILMGHSMGGKVAIEFSKEAGHLIEKLIVVDIGIKKYPVHHQQILAGLHAVKLSPTLDRKMAEKQLSEYIDSEGVKMFLLKNLFWNTQKQLAWRMNLEAIENSMENILEEIKFSKIITIPTLFMRGSLSNYIVEEDIFNIEEVFVDVQFKKIENAGHWIHAEKPQEFLNSVLEFCLR